MLIAYSLSFLAAVLFLTYQLKFKIFNFKEDIPQIKEQAIRYKRFPMLMVPAGFAQRTAVEVPIFMLTYFFNPAVTGFFALAQRVLVAPAALVANSIGNVYREEASRVYAEKGNCRVIFLNTFGKLILMSIIPFTIGFFLAVPFFEFVFGEAWTMSGQFASALMIMFFFQFISSPFSSPIFIAEKQQYILFLQVFLLIGSILAFIFAKNYFDDPIAAVRAYALIYSVKYCFEIGIAFYLSKGTQNTL
jgi:O-antigen/teichoic acid export membrane protein